ncbi:hypothetical protein AgCh_013699 [Apium graveolens]
MLVVGQDANMIRKLKEDLSKFFDMKDLGPARQILGMKIVRDRTSRKLWLSQQGYIERVLKRFNMDDAKPVSIPLAGHFKLDKKMCPSTDKEKEDMEEVPYSSAVGSLMYALVYTRPNIAHTVGVGTSGLCLKYGDDELVLEGFTDADMAGHPDEMRSTSGMLFTFAGGAVAWQSKLQKCVALSTTESEYIAACEAGNELVWLKRFLRELGLKQDNFEFYCDSQSAIDLSKNATCHSRTKHINVRYHWLREQVEDGVIQIEKIHTDKIPSDMMTKVNFEDTCKGFLDVTKEVVHQTVIVIFEDPGVQELLVNLYHKDWFEGQVTEYLIATFGDYFSDIKVYVEERSFRRFVESCLEETVIIYVDRLLTQKNYIKEETIERMGLDEELISEFFRDYITASKVEKRVRALTELRDLASSESPDSFTLVYTNILETQPDCPPDVVEKIVGLREGIPRKDAKEVVQECKEIYENSLIDGEPPSRGFVYSKVKCLTEHKGIWRKFKS